MAITQCMPDQAKADLLDGVHASGDVYKIALITNAATYDASSTTFSGTNEVANGNGYVTGGKTLTRNATTISSNHALVNFTSPATWTSSTITAAGAIIYNSSKANKIVGVFSFGGDVVSSNGDLVVTIPAGAVAIN